MTNTEYARKLFSLNEEWIRATQRYVKEPTPENKLAIDRAWQAYESSFRPPYGPPPQGHLNTAIGVDF